MASWWRQWALPSAVKVMDTRMAGYASVPPSRCRRAVAAEAPGFRPAVRDAAQGLFQERGRLFAVRAREPGRVDAQAAVRRDLDCQGLHQGCPPG
jgi:hypothetical protein